MRSTVEVTVNVKGGFRFFSKSGGADIDVVVPGNTELDLQSDNGRITAETMSGPVLAETSDGRVKLDGITGFADFKTSNGKVGVTRFKG